MGASTSYVRQLGSGSILPAVMVLLASCPTGSTGTIVGALPDTSFVSSSDRVYFADVSREGVSYIGLDGRNRAELFGSEYILRHVSDDAQTFVFGDSELNLFVANAETLAVDRIPELDGIAGHVAISPQAEIVAVSPAFETNDRIYLVSIDDLSVRIVPETVELAVDLLRWSRDGQRLWLFSYTPYRVQELDLRAEERSWIDETPGSTYECPLHTGASCAARVERRGYGGDEGLDLVTPEGARRQIVEVTGADQAGNADTIGEAVFTPDCRYVVYEFDLRLWVVDVISLETGPLTSGTLNFVLEAPAGLR